MVHASRPCWQIAILALRTRQTLHDTEIVLSARTIMALNRKRISTVVPVQPAMSTAILCAMASGIDAHTVYDFRSPAAHILIARRAFTSHIKVHHLARKFIMPSDCSFEVEIFCGNDSGRCSIRV
eukprot:TRINITY_DN31664_c0_g1_i1.p2 TRINITY_DN31664_c0_g1~~TRINITY_DN31664_c0_g1_i1.p2  ORF type:complete len:125 (+),score=8.96 TRINITY_DN31664_c0_g1_i1:293-667(+)